MTLAMNHPHQYLNHRLRRVCVGQNIWPQKKNTGSLPKNILGKSYLGLVHINQLRNDLPKAFGTMGGHLADRNRGPIYSVTSLRSAGYPWVATPWGLLKCFCTVSAIDPRQFICLDKARLGLWDVDELAAFICCHGFR